MPIKPKPFIYLCPLCGWKKSISPRSDALLPGEYYDCCPKCGTNHLKREEINSPIELGTGLFRKLFKR
jgi:Zn-finger nucleic acid-binding protein